MVVVVLLLLVGVVAVVGAAVVVVVVLMLARLLLLTPYLMQPGIQHKDVTRGPLASVQHNGAKGSNQAHNDRFHRNSYCAFLLCIRAADPRSTVHFYVIPVTHPAVSHRNPRAGWPQHQRRGVRQDLAAN